MFRPSISALRGRGLKALLIWNVSADN